MKAIKSPKTRINIPQPPSNRSPKPAARPGAGRTDLAYVQLASSEIARDINRDVVLELIRAHQPVARVDLARLSGLQKSTVSAIIEQLIEERWIVQGGTLKKPRGRHPTLVSLNDDIIILAVDVLPNRAMVAVVDLNSRLLSQESVILATNPERAMPALIQSLNRMRALYPQKTFEGIGLSMPGRIDPATRTLVLAPNMNWTGFDVAGEIERGVGLNVEMENEANACLIAEVWSGRLDGVRNAVLVAISEGIGTAILANGQMVTGKGGLAGEFGHVTMDPAGPLCGCGRSGCWEMFASSNAAKRYYAEATGRSPDEIVIHRLLNMAAEGDPNAIAAMTRQAECLAEGLHAIIAALAPEVILFTGDLTTAWTQFGPIIEERLKTQLLAGTPPRLMTTLNPEFARLRGAAALVLQRHSGYHRLSPARSASYVGRPLGAVSSH